MTRRRYAVLYGRLTILHLPNATGSYAYIMFTFLLSTGLIVSSARIRISAVDPFDFLDSIVLRSWALGLLLLPVWLSVSLARSLKHTPQSGQRRYRSHQSGDFGVNNLLATIAASSVADARPLVALQPHCHYPMVRRSRHARRCSPTFSPVCHPRCSRLRFNLTTLA